MFALHILNIERCLFTMLYFFFFRMQPTDRREQLKMAIIVLSVVDVSVAWKNIQTAKD